MSRADTRVALPADPPLGHRVQYLESVRGLAAVGVVCHHLLVSFWPDLMVPDSVDVDAAPLVVRVLLRSPASVLVDGDTQVVVFFVLSGFVLSMSYFRSARPAMAVTSAALRRYVRLAGPVLASVLLGYGLMRLGAFHTRQLARFVPNSWLTGAFTFTPRLFDTRGGAIGQGLWEAFLLPQGPDTYNRFLWTLAPELSGSYLVFAVLALAGQARHRWVAYAALGWALVVLEDRALLDFVLGMGPSVSVTRSPE